MKLKAFMANCLLSVTIITNITSVPYAYAADMSTLTDEVIESSTEETEENVENESVEEQTDESTNETNITDEEVIDAVSAVEDITSQINGLYSSIAETLNIDTKYVRILHLIAGGNAVYADKKPNIYSDLTVDSLDEPFKIDGANTEYRQYRKIECPDETIERPSKYYLPDAAYSVTYDIVQLMNERLHYDRGGSQIYFDSLKSNTKKEIIFCEAMMLYTGETEDTANKFYRIYEKLVYDKQKGDNVIEIKDDGKIQFKSNHIDTLIENGIRNEKTLKNLAIALSFDATLAETDNAEDLTDAYVLPYISNYTSRENMMIAAMCLTGKVRYTWAGGHSGMSEIDGINPAWQMVNDLYAKEPTTKTYDDQGNVISETSNASFGKCIKPSGSWCPIHGYSSSNCSYNSPIVYSLDSYIDYMSHYFDTDVLDSDKYRELMKDVTFYDGVSIDTINGLDCSGYASWIYNQITSRYTINTTAANFTNSAGLKEVTVGSNLLPGDIFAWSSHIVTIIGKTSNSNKVYVTTEATPNVLKFGVVYYEGASQSEISRAIEIARQANQLIGGLNQYEEPHCYNMTAIANKLVETEEGEEFEGTYSKQAHVGRFKDQFIDEDTTISDYNLPIKYMTAQDIIQYTLRKLPYSYVLGYNSYTGDIFDKTVIASDLGLSY